MPTKKILFIALSLSFLQLQGKELLLSSLCQKGIENNPKIKSYAHKSSASRSYYDQSIDRYKPQFNVSGQYGNDNYHYDYTDSQEYHHGKSFNYNLVFKQAVYRPRLIEGITDAKARKKLAKLQEEDEKSKLTTMILRTTMECIRQKKIIKILEKKQFVLKSAYNNIDKKFKAKLASSVDKYQALAKYKQSSSDLTKAKQNYEYDLYNLRLLTKYDKVEKYITSLDFNVDAVIKSFNKSKFRSIIERIHNNTRIRLDKQSVEISKIQIGLRNSERLPQVDMMLSYGDAGGTIDAITRQEESRAMLTLSYPVFQGGYVEDRVKESKYLYLAAQEEAEDTKLNIKISLEKSIQNIKGGIESIKSERVAVDASKKYYQGSIQSYQGGVASLTDAYLAEADYRDNQLRLVNTEADMFNSIIEAYYYIGNTSYKDIRQLQKKYFK